MTSVQFKKNETLFTEGQSLTHLYLILKGSVQVSFPGGKYQLDKGDIVGVCDAASDIYLFNYQATEDTTLVGYAYSGLDGLEGLFSTNGDLAGLFCISAFRQANHLLRSYNRVSYECSMYHGSCQDDYASYRSLCKQHMIAPRPLPLLADFECFDPDTSSENWMISYYSGIYHMFTSGGANLIAQEPAAAVGLIGKTALDAQQFLDACKNIRDYQTAYYHLYMNSEEEDFFTLYTSLYFKISADHPDRASLLAEINRMILRIQAADCLDSQMTGKRISAFRSQVQAQQLTAMPNTSASDPSAGFMDHLKGSLDTILAYSGVEHDIAVAFKEAVFAFRQLPDPAAAEEPVPALRKKITELFYQIYQAAFEKSLGNPELPIPVKLFLYFGYVDETLAGTENAAALYTLADAMDVNRRPGVYTLYDWLRAISRGEKEPSRNQYDEDYTDYLHSLKASKKITEQQERLLLADTSKKILYELKNMFPVVNKMTCGRISSYCPIFTSHQVIKPLPSCYVAPDTLLKTLDKVRSLDHTAFYRETVYVNEACNIPREFIHVECLPDFILMPNLGTRGVMWQEIEGKKRTTPCRMMLPIFLLEDLDSIIVRLTGEFRWEMCKRIQGPHWNDISERSLTSEYFDYIQFYRKNHELSAEAKEKIKNSLQKARNNFKEMFVQDYLLWIQYEGTGSPRLNKLSRGILFTYCPFSTATRKVLSGNPLYREIFDRYDLQIKRRLHHLEMLETKMKNSGQELPPELLKEKEFIEG